MKDPRFRQLALQVVNYAVRVQAGEHVLLRMQDIPEAMIIELIRAVREAGGHPHLALSSAVLTKELQRDATEEQFALDGAYRLRYAEDMHVHIYFSADYNSFEASDVSAEKMGMVRKYFKPASNTVCNSRKWTILSWPTPSMAQAAGMNTEEFEDFYFRCCLADYAKLAEGMLKLKAIMDATDEVRIEGPGTDLTFSIKDIPAIICAGDTNIPDGEIYTAPVKDSVNGVITYNVPTIYHGVPFDGVRFRFENGKIVEAHCNGNEEELNKILDTDEGARYIGEFAFGLNPYILHPMRDILFDEKIAGSYHITPGQCYDEAPNGNHSAVHWDLIDIQRKEYGGGEIYFDGKLIRKDGIFTDPELAMLNPAT